jgi:hypothetical protein
VGLTVGLIVEDVRFAKFLEAAHDNLCSGLGVTLGRIEKTQGCRPKVLQDAFRRMRGQSDLLVIGADAKSAGRRVSHRKKRGDLQRLLQPESDLCFAVADPSVEAWLYCEPRPFREGIEAGTGEPFRAPSEWPVPKSEQKAKEMLGNLIHEGCGGAIPDHFDFAPEIVGRMDLVRASNPSLADWARIYRKIIERLLG